MASRDRSPLSSALELAADAVLLVDRRGRIHEATGAVSDIFGRTAEALPGETVANLCLPAARQRLTENLGRATRTGRHLFSTQIIRGDGVVTPVEVSARATDDSAEASLVCIVREIGARALSFPVERLRLEDEIRRLHLQLLQAQKLEAVGLLASGMAHDFNNLLNVIMGYTELLARSLAEADTRRTRIEHILQAAARAGTLTRSLLAFGRKPVQQAQVIDFNALVRETEWMLRRLIGEDVELVLQLGEDVGNVKVDPGQLEQVLLNLAVNARHAMLRGGTLTLATDTASPDRPAGGALRRAGRSRQGHRDRHRRGHGRRDPGPHLRAFLHDPVPRRRGAASVWPPSPASSSRAAASSRSRASRDREPPSASTCRASTRRRSRRRSRRPRASGPGGTRRSSWWRTRHPCARYCARPYSFSATGCSSPRTARPPSRPHEGIRGRLDLLVTDVVMPRLDGCELARRLSAERPGLRVLYMSGHGLDTATRRGMVEGSTLLEKPFSTETLSVRVREALDRPRPTRGQGPYPF